MAEAIPKTETTKAKPQSCGSNYLSAMAMSSVSPARRRESNQTVRKVHKHIDQMPMPNGISIRVGPTLHPLVIQVPPSHVMAHKQPSPIRHRRPMICNGNRSYVKRVVKGLEVGARLKLLEGSDWVRNGDRGFLGIEGWGWWRLGRRGFVVVVVVVVGVGHGGGEEVEGLECFDEEAEDVSDTD